MTDVLVVGAGHNGLTAACYLARAGLEVEVVEANAAIGGCTTSGVLVPEAPLHTMSPCAGDVVTMRSSTVEADLELPRYGYREVEVDPSYLALSPGGESIAFWRDTGRTAAELRRFSTRDAAAWTELVGLLDGALDAFVGFMALNPTRPDPRRALKIARAAAAGRRGIATVAGLLTGSAAQAIDERFEHPTVRGAMGLLASLGAPITGEGTGVNLMVFALLARSGMGRPVGGMGSLPAALQRCLAAHDGRVRTAAPVEELIVRGDAIAGVRLVGGEELHARAVLTATDPRTALTELVPRGALSARDQARVDHIPVMNDGCTHFKVDVAAKGRVELSRHRAWRQDDLDIRVPSHLIGDLDVVSNAIADAKAGRVADPHPIICMIPSSTDPSAAPPDQDTVYLWSGWTPHHPPQGWEALRAPTADLLVRTAGRYYDRLEELEIGRWVEAWPDISARTHVTDGNVYHVDLSLLRNGPLRPALGFGGYRTPLPGLFITGAGTHPGPSVSGIPGQQAARTVLRALGSDRNGRLREGPPGVSRDGAPAPAVEQPDRVGAGR